MCNPSVYCRWDSGTESKRSLAAPRSEFGTAAWQLVPHQMGLLSTLLLFVFLTFRDILSRTYPQRLLPSTRFHPTSLVDTFEARQKSLAI